MENVRQVYHFLFLNMGRDMYEWYVKITTKPRRQVEIDNIEDEVSYQYDWISPIISIAKIESNVLFTR